MGKKYVAVTAHDRKLLVKNSNLGTVVSGPYELPFEVPHVLAAERWVEAFEIEPLYSELRDADKNDYYLDSGDEALCDECETMFTVGDVDETEFLSSDAVVRLQRLYSICCEDCAISYVFRFRNGPSIETVKANFDAFTSL